MKAAKINWQVRFNRSNITFIVRFVGALLVPILVYLGLELTDITSWPKLFEVLLNAISNPYVVGMTILNAINLIPDPTTTGISDSEKALTYTDPK